MSDEKRFEHLKIEKVEEGNYAIISINRPDKLNALQNQTLREIAEALETVEVDQSVRCVDIRGTREFTKKSAFSAGADLSSREDSRLDPENLRHWSHAMYLRYKYYDLIEEFQKLLIAAVDGYAPGGGLELVLVCDIVIASKRSEFGFPEIRRGKLTNSYYFFSILYALSGAQPDDVDFSHFVKVLLFLFQFGAFIIYSTNME